MNDNESCRIERQPLPGMAGVTAIRIVARTAERVQREIDRIFQQVGTEGGIAEFRNPKRDYYDDTLYTSTGYCAEG